MKFNLQLSENMKHMALKHKLYSSQQCFLSNKENWILHIQCVEGSKYSSPLQPKSHIDLLIRYFIKQKMQWMK